MIRPFTGFAAITKSDTVNIKYQGAPRTTDGIYVGVTGDVTIDNGDGTTTLFKGVPAGTVLYISTKRVNSTGTTATDLIALFRV